MVALFLRPLRAMVGLANAGVLAGDLGGHVRDWLDHLPLAAIAPRADRKIFVRWLAAGGTPCRSRNSRNRRAYELLRVMVYPFAVRSPFKQEQIGILALSHFSLFMPRWPM